MTKKRKQYSQPFKFKVALEAVQELKTISEIASTYNLIFVQSRRVLTFSFKLERFQLSKNAPNSTFPNKITGQPNFSFDLAV